MNGEKRRIPLRPGIFYLPQSPGEDPYLIGTRCKSCGKYFYPKRKSCLHCGKDEIEEVPLSRKGEIWTYTISYVAQPWAYVKPPYIIALVKLPEGVLVQTVIDRCDINKVRVGMRVEMVVEKVGEDSEGNELWAYKFVPWEGER